jgi:hypothetical protein
MQPQNQNAPQPAPPQPQDTAFKPDIVSNIPVRQAGPATPVNEAEDIDGLMRDVNHQLKKEDVKPAKHHWFSQDAKPAQPSAHPPAAHHASSAGARPGTAPASPGRQAEPCSA